MSLKNFLLTCIVIIILSYYNVFFSLAKNVMSYGVKAIALRTLGILSSHRRVTRIKKIKRSID